MFADLLLTVAIVTSAPAIPSPAAVTVDPIAARTGPSCITGPVRVRFRTQGGTVQIVAHEIRVDGVDRPATDKAQSD